MKFVKDLRDKSEKWVTMLEFNLNEYYVEVLQGAEKIKKNIEKISEEIETKVEEIEEEVSEEIKEFLEEEKPKKTRKPRTPKSK